MSSLDQVRTIATGYGDVIAPVPVGANHGATVVVGQQYVYKLSTDPTRLAKGDAGKARRVLAELALNPLLRPYLPEHVADHEAVGQGVLSVYRRLPGVHPATISPELGVELGRFLRALHRHGEYASVSEFDGDEYADIGEYARMVIPKFVAKLKPYLGSKHETHLLDEAVRWLGKHEPDASRSRDFRLLHKDLSCGNLLVDPDTSQLTGVLDWEAAQTGPPEWEFAIIFQRFPEAAAAVRRGYEERLSGDLVRFCGVLQSLRFWKSFPLDAAFASAQIKYIDELIHDRLVLD